MGNETRVVWSELPADGRFHSFYARRTDPEIGEIRVYCGGTVGKGTIEYGWNVAIVTNVPAAVYDATVANMVTLAEARYGNT